MQTTPNYGLRKPEDNDAFDEQYNDNYNMDAIDGILATTIKTGDHNLLPYAVDTGVANAYVITLSPAPTAYYDGMGFSVKIAHASTGASTINVNNLGAKQILDSLGNAIASGGLKAGIIYTLRYNATTGNFIVQGKGGGGNAAAADLLTGKTATVDSGQIAGAMPENGTVNITPGTADQTIPAGHHSGAGKVAGDVDLSTGNIKSGVNIFGVAGKASVVETSDATATAAQILSGSTAYINGVKVPGTMPNKVGSGMVITPGVADQAIAQGYYGGSVADGKVLGDPDLIAGNIRLNVNLFGILGSVIQAQATDASTQITSSNAPLTFTLPHGGTFSASYVTKSGLPFVPKTVILLSSGNNFQQIIVCTQNRMDGPSGIIGLSTNPLNGFGITMENHDIYGDAVMSWASDYIKYFSFTLDGTNAYLSSDGFRLPVFVPQGTYNVIAISA